jgi:hypothetical protein
MATYDNKLVVFENGQLKKIGASDNLSFGGGLKVGGTLEVVGDYIGRAQTNVVVGDAFIDLAVGPSGTSAAPGGATVTTKRVGSEFTVSAFTAGVVATSAPKVTVSADASALADGDIVEIWNASADGASNGGLYLVKSVGGGGSLEITLYGTGGSSLPTHVPFLQNQLTTVASESGAKIAKVAVAALVVADGSTISSSGGAITEGRFAFGYGSTSAAFATGYSEIGAASVPTLQAVYNSGASITLTDGNSLTVAKPTSGSAAISLEANATSKLEVVGAALSVKTSTSGALDVTSAGALDIDAAGALQINSSAGVISIGNDSVAQNINLGTAGARTISIGSSSATAASVAASGNVSLTSSSGNAVLSAASGKIDAQDVVIFGKAAGIDNSVADGVAIGNLMYVDSSGVFQKADNDGSGTLEIEGVALEANSSGSAASKRVATVFGSIVAVKFTSAPSAGAIAYLSATAGQATTTAPTAGRVFRVGKVLSGSVDGNGNYPVIFKPQYIADV